MTHGNRRGSEGSIYALHDRGGNALPLRLSPLTRQADEQERLPQPRDGAQERERLMGRVHRGEVRVSRESLESYWLRYLKACKPYLEGGSWWGYRRHHSPMAKWKPRAFLALAVLAAYVMVLPVTAAAVQDPPPRQPLVYQALTVPSVPFASKYVRVGPGQQMHYYEAGQPEGPPVLLLHGVPTWAYLWRKVIPRLDDRGYRIIAVDLIGFGLSDRPENLTYDLGDHRRYLERFVRALGLRNLTLVGHDIGGVVGLDFAARHRGDVRALALMETFLPPVTDGQLPPLQQGLAGILADPAATRELLLNQNLLVEQAFQGPPTTLNPLARRDHDAYRAVLPRPEDRRVLPPVPRQLLRAQTRPIQRTIRRYLGWLARTRVPLLYAYGTPGLLHSPSTLVWARANVRNLTTVHVGRSGHFLQEDRAHHLARALRRWLARAVPVRCARNRRNLH